MESQVAGGSRGPTSRSVKVTGDVRTEEATRGNERQSVHLTGKGRSLSDSWKGSVTKTDKMQGDDFVNEEKEKGKFICLQGRIRIFGPSFRTGTYYTFYYGVSYLPPLVILNDLRYGHKSRGPTKVCNVE